MHPGDEPLVPELIAELVARIERHVDPVVLRGGAAHLGEVVLVAPTPRWAS